MKWISFAAIGILVFLVVVFIHLSQEKERAGLALRDLKISAFYKAKELVLTRFDEDRVLGFSDYRPEDVHTNDSYRVTSSLTAEDDRGIPIIIAFSVYLEYYEPTMTWTLKRMIFSEPLME